MASLTTSNAYRRIAYRMYMMLERWSSAPKRTSQSAPRRHSLQADPQQLEALIDRYGNSILRLAYSYVHNRADAEDLLQDTLIRYIQAAPEFENEQHEKAWLLRVAMNLSKNKIKFNKKREHADLDEGLVSQEESELQFVWEAVRQLPQAYAEVLHLFYQEGYSTAQIATLLDKKETTVRSLLSRAREKLKAMLKEAYDFAE